MIIDLILDRKNYDEHGEPERYNAKAFYDDVREYEIDLENDEISEAMDYGNNEDVQAALCKYLLNNDYSIRTVKYVLSVDWI